MQYRSLGKSGIIASVVAFGGAPISGWPWGAANETQALNAIRQCIDEGVNLLDTAPVYGLGTSEELVGKAIAGRRDKVVVATKCGLVWHVSKGTPFHQELCGKSIFRYLGRESVRYEIEQSLRRLGTDYIDLYQTHWQDRTTPISETMETLLSLKKEGKIRAIGVSNCSIEQIQRYQEEGQVDSVQEKYNMCDRKIESDIAPYCAQKEIALLAYSPLANGLLTGEVGVTREFPSSDLRHNHPHFVPEVRSRVRLMLNEMQPIADGYKIALSQLAISWTVSQPGITHVLTGVRTVQQAQENAKAGSIVLRPEDLRELGKIVARYDVNAGE